MDPGFASTCPRSTSSLSIPLSNAPMLSPACPSSRSLRNISTPVTTVFRTSSCIPPISTSSPPFPTPRSTRPPTTLPPPQVQHPRVVRHVDLVHEHHQVRHVDLPRQ